MRISERAISISANKVELSHGKLTKRQKKEIASLLSVLRKEMSCKGRLPVPAFELAVAVSPDSPFGLMREFLQLAEGVGFSWFHFEVESRAWGIERGLFRAWINASTTGWLNGKGKHGRAHEKIVCDGGTDEGDTDEVEVPLDEEKMKQVLALKKTSPEEQRRLVVLKVKLLERGIEVQPMGCGGADANAVPQRFPECAKKFESLADLSKCAGAVHAYSKKSENALVAVDDSVPFSVLVKVLDAIREDPGNAASHWFPVPWIATEAPNPQALESLCE